MAENTTSRQRGLGRGLGALIVNTEAGIPTTSATSAQADSNGVLMVEVSKIAPNPHQPRIHFDDDMLLELAASIRQHGIIQPLIVTTSGEAPGSGQSYWLVAGERRWRAAQLAGLVQVPALIREVSSQQLLEWALIENIQRADLNPLEEAAAFRQLMEEHGMTQAEVADRVGKSRPAVANSVRLLQLPTEIQHAVLGGLISAGHARSILSLSDEAEMSACLQQVTSQDLSVRQTENLVRRMQQSSIDGPDDIDGIGPADDSGLEQALQAHYRDLESRFRESIGTRVNLNRNSDGSGRLVIHFYNDDDLQQIYERVVSEAAL